MMTDGQMAFVGVIGGLRALEPPKAAEAKAAARNLGAELAKAGFGLVVYSSDEPSLEPHVVAGYVPALKAGEGKIRVRYAESQRGLIKFAEEAEYGELFDAHLFPGQDWESPFYRSIADEDVDAVVLLAGGNSTLIAGQIALARRLPILAMPDFGGAASKIWQELAYLAQHNDQRAGISQSVRSVDRLKHETAVRAERRAENRQREALLASLLSRQKKVLHAAAAFATLMLTVFFGTVYIPWAAAYPFVMFVAMIAGGATGALVRAVMWGPQESDPRASLLLGSVAGFVVGLAYLIPQWVGAPGILAGGDKIVSATDKIQFASALLVAISAGVGFDTVFNRLREQAQTMSVAPPNH